MDGRTFGFITLIALIAALGGWHYLHQESSTNTDLTELHAQLSTVQTRLDGKRSEAIAAQERLADAQAITDLYLDKKNLANEITQLEAAKTAAEAKFTEAVTLGRAAAIGQPIPDFTLPNGQMLTQVKLQKATATDATFVHSQGVVKVSERDLPADLRDRLGYGVLGAAALSR